MAKSKSFFGLRSGSTKTLTFQVNQGRQITKDRVYDVKNPQTVSQMEGRCIMATASAAYAKMREICDHSFEGITYGQNNMSEFVRQNYALLKAARDATPQAFGYNSYRDRNLYGGGYMVSSGSASHVFTSATVEYMGSSSGSTIQSVISMGSSGSATTVAQFCQANGLAAGHMATLVCLYPKADGTSFGFAFVRIKVINATSSATMSSAVATAFQVESNLPNPRLSVSSANLVLLVDVPDGTSDAAAYQGGAAFIHSEKAASGWLRSTEYLTVPERASLGADFATALATFPIGGSYVLNGGAIQ